MATVGQFYYRVVDTGTGQRISNIKPEQLYSDLVAAIGSGVIFTRVGIQAPPGTKVYFDKDEKEVIVGRSGVFELDLEVEKLRFDKPENWVYNLHDTQAKLVAGGAALDQAEKNRDTALETLLTEFGGAVPANPGEPPAEESQEYNEQVALYQRYWNRYNEIQTAYQEAYEEAMNSYNEGNDGVYEQDGYKELQDIIVDFLYNKTQGGG